MHHYKEIANTEAGFLSPVISSETLRGDILVSRMRCIFLYTQHTHSSVPSVVFLHFLPVNLCLEDREMTVCHWFGEATGNSSYTVGAVVLPLREKKDGEVKREKNPDPNYSTQWVKSGVVPARCISDRQRQHREQLRHGDAACLYFNFAIFFKTAFTLPRKSTDTPPSQSVSGDYTWDVSGDFSKGSLAKALGCSGSNRD